MKDTGGNCSWSLCAKNLECPRMFPTKIFTIGGRVRFNLGKSYWNPKSAILRKAQRNAELLWAECHCGNASVNAIK